MSRENPIKDYNLEQLSEGVFAAIPVDGGAAICNAGLVDLGGSTLVIDAFLTPSAAETLRQDALRLTGSYPKWVVNTHYHNDHIWGNQVFLPEAQIISSVETRNLIQTLGKQEYDEYLAGSADRLKELLEQQSAAHESTLDAYLTLMIGYFRGLVKDLPRLRVTLPDLTFEDRLVLYGSQRRAELITFIGGHTGSDSVVYLPDDGVLFMGDLLFTDAHPYLADGDPDCLLEALDQVLEGTVGIRDVKRFISGHGPMGKMEDVEKLVDYVQDCQQIAKSLATRGVYEREEINGVPIPEAYSKWILPRFFHANLRFMVEKYRSST